MTGGGPTIDGLIATHGIAKDVKSWNGKRKTYLKLFDGILATAAGFKVTDTKSATGNRNMVRIDGKAKVLKGDNLFSNWVNKRYSNYLGSFDNRKDVVKGDSKGEYKRKWYDYKKRTHNDATYVPRNGEIRQKFAQGFLKEITSPKRVGKEIKTYLKTNWVPNKDFFKPSTMIKGNGLTNVVLSVGTRLIENHNDPTRTGTDLAAGITTDVMIGTASTVVSATAGWAASAMTAAAVGSVVPGVGTVVGAIVGIGLGIATQTKWGKAATKKIEAGVKYVFEGAKNIGKGLFKKFGWGS